MVTDLDVIRARHVPENVYEYQGVQQQACARCYLPWPCDTAIVLAALDAETARRLEFAGLVNREHDKHAAAEAREARLRAALEVMRSRVASLAFQMPGDHINYMEASLVLSTIDIALATTPEGE